MNTTHTPLAFERTEADVYSPVPAYIREQMSPPAQAAFARAFVAARDRVEAAYYADLDDGMSPRARTRKFVAALIDPALGKPVKDAAHFYETFGRLMRRAWLSLSLGVYDQQVAAIPEPGARLHTAQVNTVDIAWQPVLATVPEDGLIVEIGTGRGNSVVRLAQFLPQAHIVSITISPEQAEITRRIVRDLALPNVEIRLGDVFDPGVTRDLIGKAHGVGAIEVTGHFPHHKKEEGIVRFASLLRRGAWLSLFDTALPRPLPARRVRYYENQSWYFWTVEGYHMAFQRAGITPTVLVDYTQAVLPTFADTTAILRRHRPALREEFGGLMAVLWPEVPKAVYLPTVRQIQYLHIAGVNT